MTHIFNDPAEFVGDAMRGFLELYPRYVRGVAGGVTRRQKPGAPKVAVIVGGGSGHYPAFAGVVGPGFADAAVVGNIFTSPSPHFAYSVAKAAHSGAGVVFSYGNYAGDVMNFGLATEQLQAEGIDARNLLVTDDTASAPIEEISKRRGIAGDFVIFKILSAAAEAGLDIDEVERVGHKANDRTRTIGTAFSGCTFPGANAPLFTVEKGEMGLGLGIHGEPGLVNQPIPSAEHLAQLMVERLMHEAPADHSGRVGVILNGLGNTKYEELFVLWGSVAPLLREQGLELVDPEVGELVTSLDMSGVSLTLVWLDDELEKYWTAPADTPAYRKGTNLAAADWDPDEDAVATSSVDYPKGSTASRALAARTLDLLRAVRDALRAAENELGRIDAIAGDGDHGRRMVRGIEAALAAATGAEEAGAGAGTVLQVGGDSWISEAGGTSGVLWGSAIQAFGREIGDDEHLSSERLSAAVEAFLQRLIALGKASLGDKTMVDAVVPFVNVFCGAIMDGRSVPDALTAAADAADIAARSTAELRPKLGRARPLAERSVGTPDPGATSFALIARVLTGES